MKTAWVFLFVGSVAFSATLRVPDDAPTIQDAIDTAVEGDVVVVEAGRYVVSAPITFRGKAITVRAAEGPEVTTIQMAEEPDQPERASVVVFESAETAAARLEGFTLTGGNGTRWGEGWYENGGGGVLCLNGASPAVSACVIRHNTASVRGGGVLCRGGAPIFVGCTITGNAVAETDGDGGGIACSQVTGAAFTDCAISDNEADAGGGILCQETAASFTACTVAENRALHDSGAGIFCTGGTLTFTACSFLRNVARFGGAGLHVQSGAAIDLSYCVVAGNVAKWTLGGGVRWSSDAASHLDHCTVTGNRGGGLIVAGAAPTVTNSIIWDNLGPAIEADEFSLPVVSFSCVEGSSVFSGEGNINVSPRFCGWGQQAEVYVDEVNPGTGDGTETDPFATLSSAVSGYSIALSLSSPCIGSGKGGSTMGAATGTCDIDGESSRLIHVAAGRYSVEGVSFTHDVSLEGAGEGETLLTGTIWGVRTGCVVSNVTITEGLEGGIHFGPGEAPTVRQVTLAGNSMAGIYCDGSSAVFEDCTVTGNNGYGVRLEWGSTVTLTGCAVTDNRGRGIFISDSAPTVHDCLISGNAITGSGGGVGCGNGATPTLTSCTIEGNEAFAGGGVSSWNRAAPTLIGCTIRANIADDDSHETPQGGGVVAKWRSSMRLINCRITENWAGERGGGVSCDGHSSVELVNATISGNSAPEGGGLFSGGDSFTAVNCILWGNAGGSIAAVAEAPAEVTFSCVEGPAVWPGDGNIVGDPRFVLQGGRADNGTPGDPRDDIVTQGDYHLLRESAAIDAGTSNGAPATDIDGRNRPCLLGFDMGAYEYCDVPLFMRGDSNADAALSIGDAIHTLAYLFAGGEAAHCRDCADVNDDGAVDISDPIAVLLVLFLGSEPPGPSFMTCSSDPTPDGLDCASYGFCE